jgi:hypothetical protein
MIKSLAVLDDERQRNLAETTLDDKQVYLRRFADLGPEDHRSGAHDKRSAVVGFVDNRKSRPEDDGKSVINWPSDV